MSARLRGSTVSARKKARFATTFAGERIALYRDANGTVHALEDRYAHRHVPLSMSGVEGDAVRCCYHAWSYRGNARISQMSKSAGRPPCVSEELSVLACDPGRGPPR
jgi:phenylpropionate dioxygenase-like ring-hydroxylating dioxygenase large terminal subunit